MESYQGILTRMEEAYRAETGQEVTAVSDLGLRLRVLAGELFRLEGELEWLGRQAFPQTAWGEELDLHGAQRGLPRREAKQAAGVLTFSRYLPLDFDLVIPAGTVAASGGEEAVEYETTEEATLTAGELTVDVPARAVAGGAQGNAASGYINTLVTPVSGIDYVVNEAAFTGGEDREPDDSYRERILAAWTRRAAGGTAGFYEELALSVEGVTLAQAVPQEDGPGTVGLYLWGQGAAPSEAALQQAEDLIQAQRELGVTVSVESAVSYAVNVYGTIKPKNGGDAAQAAEVMETALEAWFAQRKIGDPVYLTDLTQVLLEAAAVEKLSFAANMRDIAGTDGVLPVLGTVLLGEAT